MRRLTTLAAITLLASASATAALAAGPGRDPANQRPQRSELRSTGGYDHAMQPVAHSAGPQEPGHGWRYFSDPAAHRAVVISPQGDYYLSRGKGLRWAAAAQAWS